MSRIQLQKIKKNLNYQVYFYSLLTTIFSGILFITSILWAQISQIIYLNLPFSMKMNSIYYIVSESFSAMGFFSSLLFILWILTMLIFYISSIGLYFAKRKISKKHKENIINSDNDNQQINILIEKISLKNKILAILSFLFSFVSFGCVACGQAILFSILALFVTSVTLSIAHIASNLLFIFAIIFLIYASYNNFKLLINPNICRIN